MMSSSEVLVISSTINVDRLVNDASRFKSRPGTFSNFESARSLERMDLAAELEEGLEETIGGTWIGHCRVGTHL